MIRQERPGTSLARNWPSDGFVERSTPEPDRRGQPPNTWTPLLWILPTSLMLASISIWLVPIYLSLMTFLHLWRPNRDSVDSIEGLGFRIDGSNDDSRAPHPKLHQEAATAFPSARSGLLEENLLLPGNDRGFERDLDGSDPSVDLEVVKPKRSRGKGRGRAKANASPPVQSSSQSVAWVQVGPGQFVRTEETDSLERSMSEAGTRILDPNSVEATDAREFDPQGELPNPATDQESPQLLPSESSFEATFDDRHSIDQELEPSLSEVLDDAEPSFTEQMAIDIKDVETYEKQADWKEDQNREALNEEEKLENEGALNEGSDVLEELDELNGRSSGLEVDDEEASEEQSHEETDKDDSEEDEKEESEDVDWEEEESDEQEASTEDEEEFDDEDFVEDADQEAEDVDWDDDEPNEEGLTENEEDSDEEDEEFDEAVESEDDSDEEDDVDWDDDEESEEEDSDEAVADDDESLEEETEVENELDAESEIHPESEVEAPTESEGENIQTGAETTFSSTIHAEQSPTGEVDPEEKTEWDPGSDDDEEEVEYDHESEETESDSTQNEDSEEEEWIEEESIDEDRSTHSYANGFESDDSIELATHLWTGRNSVSRIGREAASIVLLPGKSSRRRPSDIFDAFPSIERRGDRFRLLAEESPKELFPSACKAGRESLSWSR